MSNLDKGSVWRKWDLHIHTPASFEWNDGKNFKQMSPAEQNKSAWKIVDKINSSDIAVFSIMDYFTFDGVLNIRKFVKESDATLSKTLLPGIELRVEAPVKFRLNIHVIFSEQVTDQELSDFKSKLIIGGLDRPLSDEAIIAAGKALPEDKAKAVIGTMDYKNCDKAAFELGIKTIKITYQSLFDSVQDLTKEKCLIILPYDTSNGISKLNWEIHPNEDYYFLKKADIFEARNKNNINLFLGKRTTENNSFIDQFLKNIGGHPKPVVSGSDAHKISDYGIYPSGKATWIKADPCFLGLKQTLFEPEGRTYIGETPSKLKMISSKATKFISKIEIKRKKDEQIDESWFDNTIELNSELIAIIGNKGSGKSAFVDIVGLLGNTRLEAAFSFLNEKKFREKQGLRANKFYANLHWVSADTSSKFLSESVDPSSVETIKYIPQNYLEQLCNEVNSEKKLFDKELKTVIFSHIDEDKRLGYRTLDELISYKTEEINEEVELLRGRLAPVLEEILSNEEKLTDEYKRGVINQLSSKKDELNAHLKNKPSECLRPDPTESSSSLVVELNQKQVEEQSLSAEMARQGRGLEDAQKRKALAEKVISQSDLIESKYKQSISKIKQAVFDLGLNINDIFSFYLDKKPIEDALSAIDESIEKIQIELNPENKNGLMGVRHKIRLRIEEISESIDEPNKKYQKYLEEIESWNGIHSAIMGDEKKVGSISYLEFGLTEIRNIPEKNKNLEEQRDSLVKNIFSKIKGLADIYIEFYMPVQDFIRNNPFGDEEFNIVFDVSITNVAFKERFFKYINRGRAGTFFGVEESEGQIAKIFDQYNFNDADDVGEFTRKILTSLKSDCRDERKQPVSVFSQVKDSKVFEIYKFIFSLDYLSPRYSLKLNNKSLDQLSPGERGTLLFIFYFMIDKDDRPLVIDQPEENLDNQTIYKVLVPCIKHAKKNRQILLVTHNPNLAVVCDAEQVIVASIDKTNGNAVKYDSGSIENPEINEKIINILEGTRPAFDNRDSKYQFSQN